MNLMRVLIAVAVVAVIAGGGCRTATTTAAASTTPMPPVLPQTVVEYYRGGINIEVRFLTIRDSTSPLHHFVFSIDSLRMWLQLRGRSRFDTLLYLPIVNGSSGLREKIDTITTEGYARWSNPQGLALDSVRCIIEATTLNHQRYRLTKDTILRVPLDSVKPFVTVTPALDAVTDTSITFALLAQRHRGFGEDYHPTSERFRVEIFDESGALRFSSNYGVDYLQAIYPVEPRIPGEYKRYSFEWLGYDNEGNILPPGRYTAVLSIVAKPYPYTARLQFDWRGGSR